MAEPMKFSLDLAEVEIEVTTGDGEVKHWKIVEPLACERDKYLNRVNMRTKIGKDGQPNGFKSFDGAGSDLLTLVLHDEDGTLVTKEVIEALPARVQEALIERARKLSGLDKDGDDVSKNA